MEELIKYFESLEARISAIEAQQAEIAQKLQANEEQLAIFGEKMHAVGERISKMVTIIQEAQSEQPEEQEPEPEAQSVQEEPVVEPEMEIEPSPEPEVTEEPKQPAPELFAKQVTANTELPEDDQASSKTVLYGTPVGDIRQAISLGDRFLYQRELFGQNAELMQKTLNDLNALRSFDEAVSYIMTHFKWDAESSTYQQFLVTLHRRFG